MNRFLCWCSVLLSLGVFAGVSTYLLRQRSRAGLDMPAYSVYSEAGDGLGEAANVLRRLGWTPLALTRPIGQARPHGLLIVAEPQRRRLLGGVTEDISESETRALLAWVSQGNTLLLMSRKNTTLHQTLHVIVNEDAGHEEDRFTPVEVGAAGGYTDGLEHLRAGSRATLRADGGLPLWWIDDRPGAVLLRRGKGRILIVADARMATREGLIRDDGEPREDNVVFLANVAALDGRDGKIYFDEYHHGLRSGGGFWSYLDYYGEKATLLLILLLLLTAAWTWAVRLGPAVPTPQTSQADAVEYATALARLYRRSGARRLLARTLARGFLDTLKRHLRLRRRALPAEILAAWRQYDSGPSLSRLQILLRGVGELRRGEASERQLLAWTQTFALFKSDFMGDSLHAR